MIGESGGFELELPRGGSWKLGSRPALMGILNCTPDSFSDGGQYAGSEAAVNAACGMVEDGADIVDVGGESTRPGADPVSSNEQLDRVIPVIRGLRRRSDVLVSIDTRDPRVGRAALEAGADIVNDVSACDDPGWVPVLTEHRCPVILMHMRGTPASMQENTNYPAGVLNEICGFLEDRIELLATGGIVRERMIVDPGIGFSKEAGQNMEILAGLRQLRCLGRPVLFGASRKFFLGSILGDASGRGRDPDPAIPAIPESGGIKWPRPSNPKS
jgi:dihydropteroate synthase